jgi:hypothetical protein
MSLWATKDEPVIEYAFPSDDIVPTKFALGSNGGGTARQVADEAREYYDCH